MSDWIQQFDEVLYEYRGATQFNDFGEDEQAEILKLRDLGMTPEEAYLDLFEEDDDE